MRWLVLCSLLVVGCGGSGGGRGGGGQWGGGGGDWGGKKKAAPTLVEVAPVERGSVGDWLISNGTVESEAAADLIPEATGRVLQVLKEEGDPVRKGDVLAVIDNTSLVEAQQKAQAEVEKLTADFERAKRLAQQGAISATELAEARYALQTAEASAREAASSYRQTRLAAPFAGIVASRAIKVGEVASSSTAAFTVVDMDRLRVVLSLPERDLPRVRVGQRAVLTSAYDEDATLEAEVMRVAPVVDAGTGTFKVTLALPPGQEVLRPGQFVSVELEVDRHDDVLVVPRTAMLYDNGLPVVYTMVDYTEEDEAAAQKNQFGGGKGGWGGDKGGGFSFSWGGDDEKKEAKPEYDGPKKKAQKVIIRPGYVNERLVEVTEGLEGGERLIVVGQSNLRDGARVETPELMAEREAFAEKQKGAKGEATDESADAEGEG